MDLVGGRDLVVTGVVVLLQSSLLKLHLPRKCLIVLQVLRIYFLQTKSQRSNFLACFYTRCHAEECQESVIKEC